MRGGGGGGVGFAGGHSTGNGARSAAVGSPHRASAVAVHWPAAGLSPADLLPASGGCLAAASAPSAGAARPGSRPAAAEQRQAQAGGAGYRRERFHVGRFCCARLTLYHALFHWRRRLLARLKRELKAELRRRKVGAGGARWVLAQQGGCWRCGRQVGLAEGVTAQAGAPVCRFA